MVVNVKKVFVVFSAVSAVLSQVAYAVNANSESSLSQLEIIDYVVLAGIIILALGMLLVILSAFMRVKNKNEDLYEDDEIVQSISNNGNDSEVYDENIADDEGILDDEESEEDADLSASGDSDVSDNSEDSEDSEENNISGSADVMDKTDDEADSDDNTDEITDSAETSEDDADNAAEDNVDIAENAEEDEAAPPEPEKTAPKARVSFTGQNNSDVKFVEFSKSATIGRRNTNDLIISDKAVSGNHCELTFVDGKVYIEDMNSTNGTFIDGERISRKELKNGDIIILGKMSFKVNISITE